MLGINVADVISVLGNIKEYLIAVLIVLAAAIIAAVVCRKCKTATRKLVRAEAGIAVLLTITIVVNMVCFGPMYSMLSLAMGTGTISEKSADEAKALCTEIAEEGIVLAKNEHAILPLNGQKLNVFGWSSTNPVYGGTGSGSLSAAYPTVSILESLEMAGIEYNRSLSDFYTSYRSSRPVVGMFGQDWTIPEPTMEEYDAAGIFEQARSYSDTAMIVISRAGGEGADLPTSILSSNTYDPNGVWGPMGVRYSEYADDIDPNKHYLELSNREAAMVKRVASEFKHVIVLVNAANVMELGWVNDYETIEGVLISAGGGQTGFVAIGEILKGTVNPSGKTIDTYVADMTASPYWNNIGLNTYANLKDYGSADFVGNITLPSFVNYVEGIYVGYKFYETAAQEGLIDYEKAVVYPFGHGLSYTTFRQEIAQVSQNADGFTVDVTVTNTGAVAGKEVVQLYFDPPYTNGGIEKASANLVAFAKTSLLAPGASETISFAVKAEELASYDAVEKKSYVLESGDYLISINRDSHHKLDSFTYTVASTVVYGSENPRSTDNAAAENQFDYAAGDVTYLSRADHFANYDAATAAPASFELKDVASFVNNSNYDVSAQFTASDTMPTTGAKNGMKLADLRGAEYDDPRWEALLDQLTIGDMKEMIAIGGYQTKAIDSVGKLSTIDCDGPASINNNFSGQSSIGFPAGVMIASTWNVEQAQKFGSSIGKMADELDVSGWYAPAMNIHRSPFAGRNFEYYSEDGILSGQMAAHACSGSMEHGVYAYIKHFALNDQETNRNGMLCTWTNEQAMREIYLKPFEIAVKQSGTNAVMSSFNYIGTRWAGGSGELLKNVLRNEWGFKGMVITDYFGVYGYMNADQAVMNGGDLMLIAYDSGANYVTDTMTASPSGVLAMRQACKNILYTVVNSRAYSNETLNPGIPMWKMVFYGADAVVLLCLALLEFASIKKYLNRRKKNA